MAHTPASPASQSADPSARQARYWRANLRLIAVLMAIGFVVTFVGSFFAPELAQQQLFGLPAAFCLAARASLLLYVAIVIAYAWGMARIESRFRQEAEAPTTVAVKPSSGQPGPGNPSP